ncbi:hypothetical protein PLICRDRAFT_50144 [Plicaturopsis crispa FD-325 SS-3]|nr:hypothetical protein PLICRDRAFT_50144 [Plicaturopsis crispa FD-325 SS-3]
MATAVDKETAKKLDAFRLKVAETAEDVVFRVFPNKVRQLQALIESTADKSSPFHVSHASSFTDVTIYPAPTPPTPSDEPDAKKRKRTTDSNGVAPGATTPVNDTRHATYPNLVRANAHTTKVHEKVTAECEELAELCDKIKLWINLTMPNGDNFGVQIQEEVLTELHRSQETAYNLRDSARQDHLNRAKICSKLIKYPHVEDYALALKEHDRKQLYSSRQHLVDIRNIYAIVTDILHKNITKIRAPKANNSVGLY